jgi:sensor histidine kinase YesM
MFLKHLDFSQGFWRVVKHIVFWLFYYFGIMALNTPLSQIKFWEIASQNYWFLISDMLATYITIYVFLPRYLATRNLVVFLLQNLGTLIFCVLLNRGITLYIFIPLYLPEYIGELDFFRFDIFLQIISVYFVVIFAAAFKFAQYFYREKQEKTSLEKQNLMSELALLRTQINPHFLFNTLNNIDSLIFSNPEKASELLIRLSDIMRYMLYDSSTEKVPIEKELHYLNNIIDLQTLRIKNKDFIQFTVEGDAGSLMISPMIFIPFVENAFKHCDKTSKSPGIEINIQIQNSSVSLFTKNYIPEKEVSKDEVGGIGMYNVKRRLELLYPNKFNLEIKKTKETFSVFLNIDLK